MAKKEKQKAITLTEAMNLKPRQVRKIFGDRRELSKVVSTMRSVARKRYEREERMGVSSNASWDLKKTVKKSNGTARTTKADLFPDVRKLSLKELQAEYMKYKQYISDDTSTSKGLDKFFDEVKNNLGIGDYNLTQKQMSDLLEIWNRVKDNSVMREDWEKYRECIADIATQLQDGLSFDEVLAYVRNKYNIEYEEREAKLNEVLSARNLIRSGRKKI